VRCFGSGAERRRPWRTTRAFITTRRAFARSRIEIAARRPRPKEDRPRLRPDRKLLPTCPAFFAARITSPTKVFGFLPPRLPWRMRPGRIRRLSSGMVIGRNRSSSQCDGAWKIDFVGQIGGSASSPHRSQWQIPQSNQPHAPRRWPAFYLAVHGLVGWSSPLPRAHTQTHPMDRQTPMRPKAAHNLGSRSDRGANSPSDCGSRSVQSVAGLTTDRRLPRSPDDVAPVVEP